MSTSIKRLYAAAVPLVLAIGFTALAHPGPAVSATEQQPLIDGSLHPELIPDRVAMTAYLISLAQSPSLPYLNVKLAHLALNASDRETMLSHIAAFRGRLEANRAQADGLAPQLSAGRNAGAKQSYIALRRELDNMAAQTFAALKNELSPAAAQAVGRELLLVKHGIRIYPGPDMSHPAHISGRP
jgi:hypothetical protein